jgi:hypothetical protein
MAEVRLPEWYPRGIMQAISAFAVWGVAVIVGTQAVVQRSVWRAELGG